MVGLAEGGLMSWETLQEWAMAQVMAYSPMVQHIINQIDEVQS